MLNPDSPLPLYHQLSQILMDQIRDKVYAQGDLMPSENALSQKYGIGRPTVRQAMDILVRKGLVVRKKGAGTFVQPREKRVDLFSLAGTSRAFLTRGIQTTSKTIDMVRIEEIAPKSANPFGGKEAYYFSRLTLVEEKPVLLEEFFLHPELFRGLDKVDLENRSLSGVVSDLYHLKPEAGEQSFTVNKLSEKRAMVLGLDTESPVLEVARTIDFASAKAAVFSRLFCRTDRFEFSQTIQLNSR